VAGTECSMSAKIDTLQRLLGTRVASDAAHAGQTIGVQALTTAKVIDIRRIAPDPDQPRRTFDDDDMADLVGSLRDVGQTDPVKVRWDAGRDRYVLIDGERRWRAAQQAGLTTLTAVIDNRPMSPDKVLELQLIENALRTDLNALEAGAAYRQLMGVWNVNQQQLAQRLHISPSKVSRAIAALELPTSVQQAVESGKVGAMSAVKQARRKPASNSRKASKTAPVRIVTAAGVVVVTVKPGKSVVDALMAAVEAERKRGAA
jgi:ParB family chromosome partitioning protein